jgi:formylglycine-generating enzyme required for sulfatase activity
MKLFISYARVDKPYCVQIIDTLDVHEVWYDQRLHAGQQWWSEIQRRLNWCDGLVYLLSPDSIRSEYCQREFHIARSLGKHIFPVLIHSGAQIPDDLANIQYADLSRGLTAEAVKLLLNSIYIAERGGTPAMTPATVPVRVPAPAPVTSEVNPQNVIDTIAEAMETHEYDRAVFLLKQLKEAGQTWSYINLEAVLHEAETALERQSYIREAEREYTPILALIRRSRTRELGLQAFSEFRNHFPDYDPENIAATYAMTVIPMLEWCAIPEGEVTVEYETKKLIYWVDRFKISKYPITNAQFQVFVDADDGYSKSTWWGFSPHAAKWHLANPKPMDAKFSWGSHPRANVCWYEAVAFCRWLGYVTRTNVSLPNEAQWQRSAQGDDGRLYPWGNHFDRARCNSKENKLRTTTPVKNYEQGTSPYGVYDLAGNVWEWCINSDTSQTRSLDSHREDVSRAVRGGSFISSMQRLRNTFHYYLKPESRYTTIGFRVMVED